MNCIIVDDEPLAIEGIKLHLKDIPDLKILETFENPLEANNFLSGNSVDLMFLDIEMPKITGLELLKVLENKPLVIITTAYSHYAVEGFELDVVDYVLKPIRFSRLLKAVTKAKEIFETRKNTNTIQENKDYIFVRAERKYVKIFFEDVIYIEGLKDYVIINTIDNKHITRMNMKLILEKLPSYIFKRINKSYIINTNFITEVANDLVKVKDKELSIGLSYKKAFFDEIINQKLLKK